MNQIANNFQIISEANDAYLEHQMEIERCGGLTNYIAIANDEALEHVGVGPDDNPPGRGSGRYPKGSGENPYQHDKGLSGMKHDLQKQGFTESEIAESLGFVNRQGKPSTKDLRAAISIEKNRRAAELSIAVPQYKATGMSNEAIGKKLGISESSVRNYLNAERKIQTDKTTNVANALKEELKTKHVLDVGPGAELEVGNGISRTRIDTAVAMLKQQGYNEYQIRVEQLGNPGQYTTVKVVADDNYTWKDIQQDKTLIKSIQSYAKNDGESVLGLLPVKSIDSKRVYINYTDENGNGGAEKDGVIELRPGVEDISLGNSKYAQVRIGVDGTHYMKGMAVYSNNVPEGYDVIYNTNKKTGTPASDVFKPMKTITEGPRKGEIDQDNPFGASIKDLKAGGQSYCLDKDGKETSDLRVINKVTDQGDWEKWSKTISSQVLAKQPLPLVKRQLELSYQDKLTEFTEIKNLTNPTIKKQLMDSFADDCDASAVHLKAKAFPGQAWYTILPVPSLKGDDDYKKTHGVDGEVYAPRYENGTTLALVRSPHAGTFEIPILRVNNNNKEAKGMLGNAPDAIGINAHIAERLSGADFDGDTVIAIPTTHTNILSTPRLEALRNFDPKSYKYPPDSNAPKMLSATKQQEMGKITNLIADMQIQGATPDEVARAVKHSMVVIDAEKHHLDYKRSALDNRIQELKNEYQQGGASTLITRAKSEERVKARKLVSVIDPETGKKVYGLDPTTGNKAYVETGETYKKKAPTKKEPDRLIEVERLHKTTKMAEATDARDLMSSKDNPHPVELAYANYANRLKELAREARLESYHTPNLKRDPAAAKEYATEVAELERKLNIAKKNAPRERQAQILADAEYKNKLRTNPELKSDKEHLKRIKGQTLTAARNRMGARKQRIDINDREWEAIQKGAISGTKLKEILDNTDADALKQRATPRDNKAVSDSKKMLAIQMSNAGFTQAEIADRIGISASTVSKIIAA